MKKTAKGPACRMAWRFASAVAAVFFTSIFSASTSSAATEAATTISNRIVCTTAPVNSNAEGNPARVFVYGSYAYVLEEWNARIGVYDLDGRTNLFYYGATATSVDGVKYFNSGSWKISKNGDGGFNKPFGMALDTFSGENRFAVADRGNNRVQLFTFDPATGEIAFAAASAAVFYDPHAVAFTESGDILVADTGNKRIVRLSVSGSSLAVGDIYALGEKAYATGICSDSDTSEGFWITDAKNQRVAYYRIADGTGAPVVSFGTVADKEFVTPRDVQIFGDSDNGKFLCVVDNQGSRVRIVEAVVSGGAYTSVVAAGDVGSYSDASLQEYEKLWRPNGVFVDPDSGVLYVADYGHNLIKWYDVVAESPEQPEPPDPPEPDKYFNFVSVETFDETGDPCTTFTNRQTIGLVITFDTNDEVDSASIVCKRTNGTTFLSTTPDDISGYAMSCENIGNESAEYLGAITLKITVDCTGGTYTTNIVAAYTLVEPPPPAEEYEEVWWHTTSITVADEKATLTWSMPTAADGLPSAGECNFRIDWRTSLTEGTWSAAANSFVVEGVTTAAGCTKTISLSDIGSPAPASCFFRVFWTNKVK